jgi:DNA-binding MarR family transcriptional regulator
MSEQEKLLAGAIDVYMSALKHLESVVSQPTTPHGLSFEQYLLLNTIAMSDEPLNLTEIAKRRDVTKGAVARQIKLLEQRGYVQQMVAPNDRRRMNLVLTTKGVEVELAARFDVEKRFGEWVSVFGMEKGRMLLQLIQEFDAQIVTPAIKKAEQATKMD